MNNDNDRLGPEGWPLLIDGAQPPSMMDAYERGRRDERKRLGPIALLRYDPDQEPPAKLDWLDGTTLSITFGPNDQVPSGITLFHTLRTEVIFDHEHAEDAS